MMIPTKVWFRKRSNSIIVIRKSVLPFKRQHFYIIQGWQYPSKQSSQFNIRNWLISAELIPVLNHTEKSRISSYYKQFSTDIEIKIIKLIPVLMAQDFGRSYKKKDDNIHKSRKKFKLNKQNVNSKRNCTKICCKIV